MFLGEFRDLAHLRVENRVGMHDDGLGVLASHHRKCRFDLLRCFRFHGKNFDADSLCCGLDAL